MTMNKIIAIIICMFGIQTMNAQTTLSIGFLKSNNWMILEDGVEKTLEEVGQTFGVTRERIRQIESKALRKLSHPTRIRKLKDFL